MASTTTTTTDSPSPTMNRLISDAIRIVESFASEPGMDLYFKYCHGIVIMSAYEASCLFSAQGGTGVLLRHDRSNNDSKWSPPCAIGLVGAGVGIQAGVEKKDIIMFLEETSMVKALSGEFQLRIGTQIGMTVGPHGEEDDIYVHFSNRGVASTASFAKTKGLSVGLSMEGGILAPRFIVNKAYYGADDKASPKKILFGEVHPPSSSGENDDATVTTKLEELHQTLQLAIENKVTEKIEYKDTIANPFLKKPHLNKID